MERLPLIPKRRTYGEISLSVIFVLLAIATAFIATRAYTPAYAFHMVLFSLCSVLAVVAINMRFDARPKAPTPLVIDGKPNYNYGPIKFASLAALFWGTAGFVGRAVSRARTRLSRAQFRSSLDQFRAFAAVAHLRGDLRLRRQRSAGDLLLCRAAHLRARIAGDLAPWFVVLGYNFFIVIAGTGYLLGVTRSQGIRRAGMVRRSVADHRLGRYLLVYLATLVRRTEPHIYVANWFYLAFIVTIAVLLLGNNPAIPISIFSLASRYIVWSGVQDAMIPVVVRP